MSEHIGPAGARVADAVHRLRITAEMQVKELSERLADLGRKIPELGLRRLEQGDRRADADDLTALALALEVTPNALMLPEISRPTVAARFALTPAVSATPQRLWEWAQGERPPETPLEPLWDEPESRRAWEFLSAGKPYLLADPVISGGGLPGIARSAADQDKLGDVVGAVKDALEQGLTPLEIRCAVELAISGALLPPEE